MNSKVLKVPIFLLFCALFAAFGLGNKRVSANAGGPPTGRTGAPGELTCSASECHLGFPINGGGGTLTISGFPATYSPGQEADITITMAQSGRSLFGFQATIIDDQGRKAGDITNVEPTRTQILPGTIGGNLRQYIEHQFNGTLPNGGQGRWTFHWKAPQQSVGRIRIFVASNAANGSGDQTGDFIYTANASSQPAAAIANVTTVSATSFAQNSALAADSIVSGFGTNLSVNVVVASSVPLPTQLDGTEVMVRDSAGTDRNASLFFVAPTQVNYLIPAGTANGAATVSVRRSGTTVAQGTIQIESVAPGLFTANASGTGLAAAVALRVSGSNLTYEAISTSSNGQISALPIDLGPETDQVFLILYGGGFKNNSGLSSVSVTVGGTPVPVLFAGASPDFVGLDQCNVGPLPRSLATRGDVDVVLTANGKTANTVKVNIK